MYVCVCVRMCGGGGWGGSHLDSSNCIKLKSDVTFCEQISLYCAPPAERGEGRGKRGGREGRKERGEGGREGRREEMEGGKERGEGGWKGERRGREGRREEREGGKERGEGGEGRREEMGGYVVYSATESGQHTRGFCKVVRCCFTHHLLNGATCPPLPRGHPS